MKVTEKWIVKDTDPSLRNKVNELTFPISKHDQSLIDKMIAYIDESFDENSKAKIRRGIAIAAEQVGLDKSVIYIHFNVDDKEVKYLLGNPKIISTSLTNSYLPLGEGCLSVDDEHPGIVKRKSRIVVKAIDLLDNNKDVTIEAAGMLAICLQHEIDHLSGILYYDRINKSDPWKVEEDWEKIER